MLLKGVWMHYMIELKNIAKKYLDGRKVHLVLQDINLEIEKKDFITIQGKSGGGKSTLMQIIGLLTEPSDGEIIFDNKTIDMKKEDDIAKIRKENIGFVFQSPNLISCLNPLDNVMLSVAERKNKEKKKYAQELFQRVGLQDKIFAKTSTLSGGEAQRVSIVRALINTPQILLCDEPTGALDVETGEKVIQLLYEIWKEKECAIILVTHDLNIAKLGKRQFVLDGGKLIEQ